LERRREKLEGKPLKGVEKIEEGNATLVLQNEIKVQLVREVKKNEKVGGSF
jgi:hypothetical protein